MERPQRLCSRLALRSQSATEMRLERGSGCSQGLWELPEVAAVAALSSRAVRQACVASPSRLIA